MAYSDSLQYLPSDITTISEEVAEGLVASGSGHDKATLLAGREVELWQDIAKQTGKARQVAFSRALRKELERLSAALPLGPLGPFGPPSSQSSARRQGQEPATFEEPGDLAEEPMESTPAPAPAPAPAAAPAAAPTPAAAPAAVVTPPVVRPAVKNARHYMQPLQPPAPETSPLDDLSLRHIDVQKDDARFASHPWMGVPC